MYCIGQTCSESSVSWKYTIKKCGETCSTAENKQTERSRWVVIFHTLHTECVCVYVFGDRWKIWYSPQDRKPSSAQVNAHAEATPHFLCAKKKSNKKKTKHREQLQKSNKSFIPAEQNGIIVRGKSLNTFSVPAPLTATRTQTHTHIIHYIAAVAVDNKTRRERKY